MGGKKGGKKRAREEAKHKFEWQKSHKIDPMDPTGEGEQKFSQGKWVRESYDSRATPMTPSDNC